MKLSNIECPACSHAHNLEIGVSSNKSYNVWCDACNEFFAVSVNKHQGEIVISIHLLGNIVEPDEEELEDDRPNNDMSDLQDWDDQDQSGFREEQ